MKKNFYASFFYASLLFFSFYSCKKNDVIPPDNGNSPDFSLDSLKTISSNIPNARYSDLTFINENTGFAITQGFIVKATDGGNTWTSINLPVSTPLKKIQFTDSQTGYIIGGDNNYGILLKTTNGGQNWTVNNLNSLECPYGMYFLNNNTGFITGKNLFIKTTDGGQTWRSLKSNAFRMFQDINFRNNNEGYITSNTGVYFKTTNGGNSWDSLRYNSANYLYDIYSIGNKILVVKSSDSLIDLKNNYSLTIKPYSADKLLFFSPEKCIGIGSHYEQGFYPYGDIFITNNGWTTYIQKTFPIVEAIGFSAIAKMNENKAMILGGGLLGTKVMILNR